MNGKHSYKIEGLSQGKLVVRCEECGEEIVVKNSEEMDYLNVNGCDR